jgi:Flp pilus assembly pilin Flp
MLVFQADLTELFKRFLHDENGQDLIEYALLTSFIAAGSLLLFQQLAVTMHDAYAGPSDTTGWNQAQQDAWQPCDPGVAC